MRKTVLVMMGMGLISSIAHAESETHPCQSASDEKSMYDCLQQELKQAETKLSDVYDRLETRYKEDASELMDNPSQADYLAKAQDAWHQYRQTSCDFETYESRTGTGFGSIYTACLLEKTQQRTNYLQWFVDNP
ncbi:lysozyme inhibitor LprI family protein [Methylophaga thalassica]|uniref:lysozyme inhibitor LprI family protein n=1 Tax=Methylophaga thalassica TaxID=40223 RepID=UPI002E7AF362|nr:lysozyme inhibitor LprI family protein [Methylophaga thalassica]WVI84623.1 lysozyme inhibitor LprI family protein [Methylophaga thalassica]